MEKRAFGKTGLSVSVLGFGGAEVGYGGSPQNEVDALLAGAIDAGLNVIDTAECYVSSEELIGKALKGRRKDVLLFTKVGHSRGYADPDWDDARRLEESLDRSLKNLGTDRVDLLQLHSCSLETLKKGLVIDFLKRAKAAGKTRFIGYSGDNEAALHAVRCGEFDALQISVSVADQSALEHILPEAAQRGLGVIAKRPIANAVWKSPARPDAYYAPYWERLRELKYPVLQDGQDVDAALRFTLSVPGVHTAIVGTRKPGRWQENAKLAARGPLDKKAFEAIRGRWRQIAKPDWVGQT